MESGTAEHRSVPLRDGRVLGIAEYGEADGFPLFYFHGFPTSRLEAALLAPAAKACGARLVAVDRPGIGLSTFVPHRRVPDWPEDVAQLADRLGIDRPSVVGFSGGAPYALACAAMLPDRFRTCAIVSGATPLGPLLSSLWRTAPFLLAPAARHYLRTLRTAERSVTWFARWLPQPDRDMLSRPDIRAALAAALAEGFQQGSAGVARDGSLLGRTPRFEAVHSSTIRLWHGEQDTLVPAWHARALADQPDITAATFLPDEGHISLIVNHGGEILRTLAADRS